MIFSTETIEEALLRESPDVIIEDRYDENVYYEAMQMALDERAELIHWFNDLNLEHGIVDDIKEEKMKGIDFQLLGESIITCLKDKLYTLVEYTIKSIIENIDHKNPMCSSSIPLNRKYIDEFVECVSSEEIYPYRDIIDHEHLVESKGIEQVYETLLTKEYSIFVESVDSISIEYNSPYDCYRLQDSCHNFLLTYANRLETIREIFEDDIVLDSSLKYDTYIATREYYNTMRDISNDMVFKESVTVGYIEEAVTDAITKYITKVTASAQENWNKFKMKVDKKKDFLMLKRMRSSIVKFKGADFSIDNYKDYDLGRIENMHLIRLEYNTMKEHLSSREAFIKQYYREIQFDNKISVKKAVKKYFVKSIVPKMEVTKTFLVEKFNFNSKVYYDIMSKVEDDMKTLNASNQIITQLAGTVMPTDESLNFKTVYTNILLEAPITPPGENENKSMSFSDRNGRKMNPNKKVTSNALLKRVNVYMDVMGGIVSAKMTALTEMYNNNMSIITMVYNRSGGGTVVTDRSGRPKTQIDL